MRGVKCRLAFELMQPGYGVDALVLADC